MFLRSFATSARWAVLRGHRAPPPLDRGPPPRSGLATSSTAPPVPLSVPIRIDNGPTSGAFIAIQVPQRPSQRRSGALPEPPPAVLEPGEGVGHVDGASCYPSEPAGRSPPGAPLMLRNVRRTGRDRASERNHPPTNRRCSCGERARALDPPTRPSATGPMDAGRAPRRTAPRGHPDPVRSEDAPRATCSDSVRVPVPVAPPAGRTSTDNDRDPVNRYLHWDRPRHRR